MRVLLDTTYLMPAIGVSVSGIKSSVFRTLKEKNHRLFISELTLFELSAKGAKHVLSREINVDRVLRGLTVVANDKTLTRIPMFETEIIKNSYALRKIIDDYIDCIIVSSAIHMCDALITEDRLIQELSNKPSFRIMLDETNPSFQILSSQNLDQLSSGSTT